MCGEGVGGHGARGQAAKQRQTHACHQLHGTLPPPTALAAPHCRKAKQGLLTEGLEALQKKVKKGKGVTKTIIDERQGRVRGLVSRSCAGACSNLLDTG